MVSFNPACKNVLRAFCLTFPLSYENVMFSELQKCQGFYIYIKKNSLNYRILWTLWERYFWMFSEHSETSSNIYKTLDERAANMFQK